MMIKRIFHCLLGSCFPFVLTEEDSEEEDACKIEHTTKVNNANWGLNAPKVCASTDTYALF